MNRSTLLALCVVLGTASALAGAPSFSNEVKANWKKHCASCHGMDGKGGTKAGRMAGVKDQTDPKYQEALSDEKMFKAVKEGLREDGKEKMKPFQQKLSDPEVQELVAYVRSFKK